MCIDLHEFVVCEHFLNVHVHTPKQRGKNWHLVGGPWRQVARSHGTTDIMVNPALCTLLWQDQSIGIVYVDD